MRLGTPESGHDDTSGALLRAEPRPGSSLVDLDLGSLAALRAAYLAGELRPLDVVAEVLARIEERGDDHVWISVVPREDLIARALELQRWGDEAGGIADRPLFGIPFAVKDNIDVAGLATTNGYAAGNDPAPAHARVVRRLIDAGAIVVGKTNLDQFAAGLNGTRSPYGAVESVFGGRLIAGGSSSGSAVAVAAGEVTFALGTDTAGSGRVPAAMNGIIGLKPTRGRISTAGVVPACRSLDCVSIFSRSLADAATLLPLAEGSDGDDPWARPVPAHSLDLNLPFSVRVGRAQDQDLDFFGDDPMRRRYQSGVDVLAGLFDFVNSVETVDLAPFLDAGELLYSGPWLAERLVDLEDRLIDAPQRVLAITRQVLEGGRRFTAVDAFRAQHRLQLLRHQVERLWQDVDLLVLPTVGTTFTIEEILAAPVERNMTLGRYTQFANLLDLAVIAVPNGLTADGRPASLSFVGPAWSEPRLLAIAARFLGEASPPPARALARPLQAGAPPGQDRPNDRPDDRADDPATAEGAATLVLAVVGRHLRGESRNHELLDRGGTLVESTRTAPEYRLFELGRGEATFPGLVRDPERGAAIEVELWRLPAARVGSFIAGVPAPLSIGWVRLAAGHDVLGFLCEGYAVDLGTEITGSEITGSEITGSEITAAGGWRAHRDQTRNGINPDPLEEP